MVSLGRCLLMMLLLHYPAAGTEAAVPGAGRIDRWNPFIEEASNRFSIPEDWIRRVMAAESGGRETIGGRPTVSPAGAMGLMQLMPGTWAEMRARHGLGTDPHDPRDNILAGTAYLRAMYQRFGYPGLFAAYNAGPSRYSRHLAGGTALPSETIAYLDRIVPMASSETAGQGTKARATGLAAGSSPLFAIRKPVDGGGGAELRRPPARLFAVQPASGHFVP